ncbi:ATP-binding domain-containing protein, partial [Lactobacillaceae bacterium Scapto_B20]
VKVLHDIGIKDARTIHSSIYELPTFSKVDHANEEVMNKRTTTFHLGTVKSGVDFIFVDEASMISDVENDNEFLKFGSGRILTDLISFAGTNTKLIFIGDNYQLPPVGDDDSYALNAKYIKRVFKLNSETYELKTVKRQNSESGILKNATKIRSLIDIPKNKRSSFNMDYFNNDVFKVNNQDIAKLYLESTQNKVVIAYGNEQVMEYNRTIRQKIFGDKLKDNRERVMSGDKIIFSKNIYRNKLYHQDILNGDTAVVINVAKEPEAHSLYYNGVSWILRFRKITFKTDSNDQIETGYIYENFLFDDNPSLSQLDKQLFYEDLIKQSKETSSYYIKYKEEMESYKLRAKKYHELVNNWKQYVSDKHPTKSSIEKAARKQLRFGNIYKPKLDKDKLIAEQFYNNKFFNAIIAKFGYAITGHKSQGGDWDTVFVDYYNQNNISTNALRWSYTATTRARKKLYVINPPESGNL